MHFNPIRAEGGLNQPPLVIFDKNFIENICYSISYSMSFNKMVLENNIRRVFAKIYILGGLLKYFLHVLRKSRGGLIQPPYPNEYLYSISIQRPIHHFITYKMVTNIWKFQPCTSNGFFWGPKNQNPEISLNYLGVLLFENIFFSNEVKSSPKCSDGAAKCFKRSKIRRKLVLM